jgi:AAA15 family ATPase/GTPase
MVASSDRLLTGNLIETPALGKLRLNRSAAVYGANASGKSNLVAALAFMRDFVLQSYTPGRLRRRAEEEETPIPVVPFLLDAQSRHEPSEFQLILIQDAYAISMPSPSINSGFTPSH